MVVERRTPSKRRSRLSKPIAGETMTEFGPLRTPRDKLGINRGVEFQAKSGAAIKAAESGTVATVESLDNGSTRLTLAHEGGATPTKGRLGACSLARESRKERDRTSLRG